MGKRLTVMLLGSQASMDQLEKAYTKYEWIWPESEDRILSQVVLGDVDVLLVEEGHFRRRRLLRLALRQVEGWCKMGILSKAKSSETQGDSRRVDWREIGDFLQQSDSQIRCYRIRRRCLNFDKAYG